MQSHILSNGCLSSFKQNIPLTVTQQHLTNFILLLRDRIWTNGWSNLIKNIIWVKKSYRGNQSHLGFFYFILNVECTLKPFVYKWNEWTFILKSFQKTMSIYKHLFVSVHQSHHVSINLYRVRHIHFNAKSIHHIIW